MSGSKAQKGFTLIEVSLAIVIGVIVLAGAITLYNQSKVSAGNSKMQEKSLALAGLVEEMAAQANGVYPSATTLKTRWEALRDDALTSPYGGAITSSVATTSVYTWGATGSAAGVAGKVETTPGNAGLLFYTSGSGAATIFDVSAGAAKSYRGYALGGADNTGTSFAFVNGGK